MKTKTLLATGAAVMLSVLSQAQNTKYSNSSYSAEGIPFEMKEGIKLSLKTHTPLVLTNLKETVSGNTPEQMAMNWIAANMNLLQVKSLDNVSAYSVRSGLAGHNVRLRQQVNGVDVYGSEIVVHISPKNMVTYVTNTFDPTVDAISTSAGLTAEQAIKIAETQLGVKESSGFQSNELNIYNEGNETVLVYKIVLEPGTPVGSWEVLVDANTGNVLHAMNKACNHKEHNELESCSTATPPPGTSKVDGSGYVFDPDPLSHDQAQYAGAYVDNNDATNATFDAAMINVTLPGLTFNGTDYELVGQYAEITDFENPFRGDFAQPALNFDFNRNDAGFEAVMCYYHIDKSLRYINETLAIPLMPFQYAGGMQYDPHGLNGQDNSHYLGGSGRISFGEGGVDDAEDADVILHELGHGLHDWLTAGNLSQVNGLSEGCGDYWAHSYSTSLNQWTTADPEYYWMFSWDGHNPFWNGRITNYGALYPGGLTGSIHTDGQIWATTLMRIWEQVGRQKVDMAFLEGLAMTGGNTSQEDAAIAVRQAAIDMGYSCADVDVFTTEFTATGYNMPAIPAPSGTENSTICEGESIVVNGTVYDMNNPTGTEVIPGGSPACDSTVTINLTVIPAPTGSETSTICEGDNIVVNGTVYDANNPTGTEVFAGAGANGCDSTVTVNLTIETVDATIAVNGTTLTANQTGATYQWVDCDNGNSAIVGETGQSFTATTDGNYAVEVTFGNCTQTSACQVISTSGITEIDLNIVQVYPNPSNGLFTVVINSTVDQFDYTVTSVDGKVIVDETNVTSSKINLDLRNESKGIYFLRFNNNESVTKLIVE